MREKVNTLTAQAQPQEKSSSSSDESKSSAAESPKGTGRGGGKAKRTTRKVKQSLLCVLFWIHGAWVYSLCHIKAVDTCTDGQNTLPNFKIFASWHLHTFSQVKFTTPPKYKTKHSISGMMRKNRAALQTLQPAASNPKLLVGSGSPRIAAIGKPKKGKVWILNNARGGRWDYIFIAVYHSSFYF